MYHGRVMFVRLVLCCASSDVVQVCYLVSHTQFTKGLYKMPRSLVLSRLLIVNLTFFLRLERKTIYILAFGVTYWGA